MKIDVKLQLDTLKVQNRLNERVHQAQKYLDSEVLRTSAPFVPYRDGNLMRSGDNATQLGSGEVIYNTPYAKAQYYGRTKQGRDSKGRFTKRTNFNYSTDTHPQASAQWFEKAKAIHKDAWKKGVEQIIKC